MQKNVANNNERLVCCEHCYRPVRLLQAMLKDCYFVADNDERFISCVF